MVADSDSLRPEYRCLFQDGVSSEDGPRILLPLLDGVNHVHESPSSWHYDAEGLAVSKTFETKPGAEICYPYDKPGERLNNTICKNLHFLRVLLSTKSIKLMSFVYSTKGFWLYYAGERGL